MNVEKRIERNTKIAELVKSGVHIDDVAIQFNLDPAYVRTLAKSPKPTKSVKMAKRNEKIRQMYEDGLAVSEVSKKLKLHEQSVRNVLKDKIQDRSLSRAIRNKKIIECAQNGDTLEQLVNKFKLSKGGIYAILKSRGIAVALGNFARKRRAETDKIIARNQEIKQMHESGASHAAISDKFKITRERVRQIVEKLGCQTRTDLIQEKKDSVTQAVKEILFDMPTLSVSQIAREMELNPNEEFLARKSISKEERKILNAKRTELRLADIEAKIVKMLKDNEELFILNGIYLTATVLQVWMKPRIQYFKVMGKNYDINYWRQRIYKNHPDLRRFIDTTGQRKLNRIKDLEAPYCEIEDTDG